MKKLKLINIVLGLGRRGMLNWMPDKTYLGLIYALKTRKKMDVDCPKTFNDKLQWLKLNDRKKKYTRMVDKFEAKKYTANIIGEEYIIPTLGIYDKFESIDFSTLPNQFVIKCTHDSGSVIVVKNKNLINYNIIRKKISRALKHNGYNYGREWPYKNVKPRIIVEKYMDSLENSSTIDYKFFCFNGKPEIVLACSDRFSKDGLKETWFDSNWNLLPLTEGGHKIDKSIQKPQKFEEMKKLAKKLAKDIAFVRIDFYEFDGKVYFGEITFFPASGFERFDPEEWNKKLGDMIDLSLVKNEK